MTITAKSSADIIPLDVAKPTPSAKKSFEAFKEAWQLQIAADNSLPAGSLRVALAISSHMNRSRNGLAWPGYNRLQKMLGIGRRTVIRNVQRLEKTGHLSVERRRNGTKNAPNQYRPRLKEDAPGDTTLVSQLWHHPSVIAMAPEPLNEPLNEPLSDTAAIGIAAKVSTNDSDNSEEEGGRGRDGLTVATSDNPSLPSARESEEQRQRLRQRFESLGSQLRSGLGVVPPGRRVGRT